MRYMTLLSIIILALLGSGCSPKVIQPTISGPGAAEKGTGPAETIKMGENDYQEGKIKEEELAKRETIKGRTLDELATTAPLKDIFFDYDSYLIRPDHIPTLNEIAKWLKENDGLKIIVEGHCDERGTVEYNLVLGQKRAESVKSYLVKAGIDEKRIRTISYGKEVPIDPGHNEAAWAKNRRVHFELTK